MLEEAANWYTQASQIFLRENSTGQANAMALKANEIRLETKQWAELKQVLTSYKQIAKRYLTQQMLKTSAKDLLFLHILCYLAMDDKVGAKKAI